MEVKTKGEVSNPYVKTMAKDLASPKEEAEFKKPDLEEKKPTPPADIPTLEKRIVSPETSQREVPRSKNRLYDILDLNKEEALSETEQSKQSPGIEPVKSNQPLKPPQPNQPPKQETKLKKEANPLKFKLIFFGLLLLVLILCGGGLFYWWNYLKPVDTPISHFQCQDLQCIEVEGPGQNQCQINDDCLVESIVFNHLIEADKNILIDITESEESLADQIKEEVNKEEAVGTVKTISVQSTTLLNFDQLIEEITQKELIESYPVKNYTFFVYYQKEGPRTGLILETTTDYTVQEEALLNEPDLKNFDQELKENPLLIMLYSPLEVDLSQLADTEYSLNEYQNNPIFYVNFPEPDLSFDYTLIENKLVITTSRDSVFKAIDLLLAKKAEVVSIPESETEPSGIINCGFATYNPEDFINEINFEEDEALTCLGRALINDCQPAFGFIETVLDGQIKFEVKNEKGGCLTRLNYGEADQIPDPLKKANANKYFECPFEEDELNLTEMMSPDKEITDIPGSLAFFVYFNMSLETTNPNTTCSGNLSD